MKRTLLPLALFLSACDPTPPPAPETEAQPSPIFETQVKAVDKARAVEGQLMESAEAQRKQMDEAEQQ